MAQDLLVLGVKAIPDTQSGRQNLWEFLLKPTLKPEEKQKRWEIFSRMQDMFVGGKRVSKVNDSKLTNGRVEWIAPTSTYRAMTASEFSWFEARISWVGAKPNMQRLDMIELLPEAQSP